MQFLENHTDLCVKANPQEDDFKSQEIRSIKNGLEDLIALWRHASNSNQATIFTSSNTTSIRPLTD